MKIRYRALLFLSFHCLIAAKLQATDPSVWLHPLDLKVPVALAEDKESVSFSFAIRFFDSKSIRDFCLYGSVGFQLKDSKGMEVHGEYGRDFALRPERADYVHINPGEMETAIWTAYYRNGMLSVPDRMGGTTQFKGLHPGEYELRAFYGYNGPREDMFFDTSVKLEIELFGGDMRTLVKGPLEFGSFKFTIVR